MSELNFSLPKSDLNSMLKDKLLEQRESVSLQPSAGSASPTSSVDFIDALGSAIQETNESIKVADQASKDFAVGKAENLHDVMIAMEKADLSLRTLTAVRGKIIEAYQEIMRMPV